MLSSNRRVGGVVRKYLFSWCLLIAALCVGSSVAQADNVYDWKGTCTLGCAGTATGGLKLANGASPCNFSASQFLSFNSHHPKLGPCRAGAPLRARASR